MYQNPQNIDLSPFLENFRGLNYQNLTAGLTRLEEIGDILDGSVLIPVYFPTTVIPVPYNSTPAQRIAIATRQVDIRERIYHRPFIQQWLQSRNQWNQTCPFTREILNINHMQIHAPTTLFRNVFVVALQNAIRLNPAEFTAGDNRELLLDGTFVPRVSLISETFNSLTAAERRDAESALQAIFTNQASQLTAAHLAELNAWGIRPVNLQVLNLARTASQAFLNACAAGNVAGAEAALRDGADVNTAEPAANFSALQLAIVNGHLPVIALLVRQNALKVGHRNNHGNTALDMALGSNRNDIAQLLYSAPVNQALLNGAVRGNYAETERAINEGADINTLERSGNCSALHLACIYGHTQIVRLLVVQPKLNIGHRNIRGESALQIATAGNKNDITQLLVTTSANQALLNAAASNNLPGVQLALKNNADINTFEAAARCTALQLATMKGYSNIVDFLANQKAINFKHKNIHQKTALQIALDMKKYDLVTMICSKAVNQKLLNAAGGGDVNSLRAALAEGADINTVIGNGVCNAIQLAIQNSKSPEIVGVMIAEGADLEFKNSNGLASLEIAKGCVGVYPNDNRFKQIESKIDAVVTPIRRAEAIRLETARIEAARIEAARLQASHGFQGWGYSYQYPPLDDESDDFERYLIMNFRPYNNN